MHLPGLWEKITRIRTRPCKLSGIPGHNSLLLHYGTFDMADEPMGETEQILNRLKAEWKINNELKILKLGETLPV
jgi:hypothetical protein